MSTLLKSGPIDLHHEIGSRTAVIFSHGSWSAGGFFGGGNGMVIVPVATQVLFLAADDFPAVSPGPERLVVGNTAKKSIVHPETGAEFVMNEAIRFNSISGPGSTIKNYLIERHERADEIAKKLNTGSRAEASGEAPWSLIMPRDGTAARVSDVFLALKALKLEFRRIVYAACRVRA